MGDVIPFVRREYTMNVDFDTDGFRCLVCGHWLYESTTEWGDLYECRPARFGHIHGTSDFAFCPHCGSVIVDLDDWGDIHPEDVGLTVFDVERRYADAQLADGEEER